MTFTSELSHAVKSRRTEMGLTQADLANLVGLSRTTVNDLEQGRLENLGLSRAEKILNTLGMVMEISQGLRSGAASKQINSLELAARSASVSYRKMLTQDVLRGALLDGAIPSGFRPHIRTLLDEAPVSVLSAVAHQLEREGHLRAKAVWQRMRSLAVTLGCVREIWN